MCFTVLAWKRHKDFPLLLGFNRDEFLKLEASPAAAWEEGRFFAGKHLPNSSNPGTWMGLSQDGRFAALTNVRDFRAYEQGKQSRGDIVRDYLRGDHSPQDYLKLLSSKGASFNPFNLLVGSRSEVHFFTNHPRSSQTEIKPGIHGFSNGKLNEAWPKVERGKAILRNLLEQSPSKWTQDMLALLADTHQPSDRELPDTHVGIGLERLCAPIFMQQEDIREVLGIAYGKKLPEGVDHTYGTRTSTVLMMGAEGKVQLTEVTFFQNKMIGRVDHEINIPISQS
jgi:uncharacterized protein with NRDE domain